MVIAWIIVLISALVGTRATNKLKRTRKSQSEGEFVTLDESETESEDWDKVLEENAAKAAAAAKGKAPASTTPAKAKSAPTAAEKGKAPAQSISMKRKTVATRKGRARGIEIEEPVDTAPPPQEFVHVNTERIKDFEKRECIGERNVNIAALTDRSAAFGILLNQAGLAPICKFTETSGYCLHLVRMFYQCATNLVDQEDGLKEFTTTVRNVKIKITPQVIGEVLGMNAQSQGAHYLKGHVLSNNSWRTVVDGICLPDTRSAGNSVYSKELRPEYRYLNFIVCYNILPNMNSKVLRWDRMLYLYLIGHPDARMGSNINVPFLIWSRMARYVENAHPTERLPFPMIIMRILRKLRVDTGSSTYMHSLGTINDSTIVKSLSTKTDETPTPPRGRQRTGPTATPTTTSASASASEDASVTSIYMEQKRLSSEQERLSNEFSTMSAEISDLKKKQKSLAKLVKKIFRKLGCSSSDDSD